MKVIGVALAESSVAALTARQHRAVSLDHKRAVLTTYDLRQQAHCSVTTGRLKNGRKKDAKYFTFHKASE